LGRSGDTNLGTKREEPEKNKKPKLKAVGKIKLKLSEARKKKKTLKKKIPSGLQRE